VPAVSVIVPCYNHERYVAGCLDAIDAQVPPLEIVVIDDGSSDGTWEEISKFRFQRRHEVVRIRSTNRGAHAALNEGLRRARSPWVAICNSDDVFAPRRLQSLMNWAERSKARFLFSSISCIDDAGREVVNAYAKNLLGKQSSISAFPTVGWALVESNVAISTGNFFFERKLVDEVGFFRPYRLVHDWDFVLRALLVTEPVWVPEPLYAYRLHGSNSFTALMGEVAARECPELMRRYWKAAVRTRPSNVLAPSPHHWPVFGDLFLKELKYQPYMTDWDRVDGPFYAPDAGIDLGER
jgi:glycosyltransferase involved in cell wall biosynthesis